MEQRDAIGYALLTTLVNVILMIVKIVTGIIGNSYALIADGIESASDVLVSLVTWIGFSLSLRPADEGHPYGHGRIESLAGMFSGLALLAQVSYEIIIKKLFSLKRASSRISDNRQPGSSFLAACLS